MHRINDYRDIIGDERVSQLYQKAKSLYGKHILHLNSTYQGGGVAEMLMALVPLFNDIGIEAGWRILHGNPDFFVVTKKIHNALQGENITLTEAEKTLYIQTNEAFATYTHLDHDCVIIHDPQPMPLINFFHKRQPWVWRCHIDLSNPNRNTWEFLEQFVLRYDEAIVSNEKYATQMPIHHNIIFPAIDPMSSKNNDMSDAVVTKELNKYEIPRDKPIVCQISRFDKWKDPIGVIEVFKMIKKKVDCRLVLCGSMASDDPEGLEIYDTVRKNAKALIDSGDVILTTSESNTLVNALQRASAVIIQKSLREGFGLTVSEALWKGTPVLASNVGGIPLQIQDGVNGYLLDPTDFKGYADKAIELLENPKRAKEMGERGIEHVRQHFLITRVLSNYLDLLNNIFYPHSLNFS